MAATLTLKCHIFWCKSNTWTFFASFL